MLKDRVEHMLEKRNEGGFTLIELLIVIIILAILAAIVVFAVGTTGANSKYTACSQDAKTFETALESYKAQLGTYPTAATAVAGGVTTITANNGSAMTSTITSGSVTAGPFLRAVAATSHYVIATDGAGQVYVLPPSYGATNVGNLLTSGSVTVNNGASPTTNQIGTSATVKTFTNSNINDTSVINFDANNAICSDSSVVQ